MKEDGRCLLMAEFQATEGLLGMQYRRFTLKGGEGRGREQGWGQERGILGKGDREGRLEREGQALSCASGSQSPHFLGCEGSREA